MQMSIHYGEEDQYLIDKLEKEANLQRKSKSAMLLSILEEHFEAQQRIGEILRDMRAIDEQELQQALQIQRKEERKKRLGGIMLERGYVEKADLDKALAVQSRKDDQKF